MANRFYFSSGSAGHTASATYPGSPLMTFRTSGSRLATASVATLAQNPPIQARDGAAGTSLVTMSWFSPPLQSFTLSGSVTCSVWGNESGAANNATVAFRLWHKSGSFQGTGSETPMMLQVVSSSTEWNNTTTPAMNSAFATMSTTIFQSGDRIVCRLYASGFGGANMAAGTTTMYYAAGASGSLGDSVLIFGQDIPLKKKIRVDR